MNGTIAALTLSVLSVLLASTNSYVESRGSVAAKIHLVKAASTPPPSVPRNPRQESLNTFRNEVNGIAIGSTYEDVRAQFGGARSIKKGGTNPCGGKKSVLHYSGISFTMDRDESGRSIVVLIEITSPSWEIAPGIRPGFTVEEVRTKMGQADDLIMEDSAGTLWYADGDGYLTFVFKKGKLVRILRDLNQC